MAIIFDKTNKIILIEKTQSKVTIQELINAIRDFEDNWLGIDEASLANAYGKQDLGGGAKVGITLELINNWRIQFEDRTEWTTCYIKGGNLVAINNYDNNPIKPSAYVNTIIAQSSAPTIAEPVISEQDKADIISGTVSDIEAGKIADIEQNIIDLDTKHGTGSWEGASPEAILEELVSDHKEVEGSLADYMEKIKYCTDAIGEGKYPKKTAKF